MAVAFEEHDGSKVAMMVDLLWARSRCKKTSRTAEKSQQPFSDYTSSKISAKTSAREAVTATPASKSTVLPIVHTKQADNSNCELCSENQTEKENETTLMQRSSSFPPKKRGQYKSYSLDFKLAVVRELYKSDVSVSDMARKYNLPHSTINSWESELRRKNKKVSIHKKGVHLRTNSGRQLSYPKEIDEELVEWVLVRRDCQLPV